MSNENTNANATEVTVVEKSTKGRLEAIGFTVLGGAVAFTAYEFGGKALKATKNGITKLISKTKKNATTDTVAE